LVLSGESLTGKPVEVGCGPAAVIGDETWEDVTVSF